MKGSSVIRRVILPILLTASLLWCPVFPSCAADATITETASVVDAAVTAETAAMAAEPPATTPTTAPAEPNLYTANTPASAENGNPLPGSDMASIKNAETIQVTTPMSLTGAAGIPNQAPVQEADLQKEAKSGTEQDLDTTAAASQNAELQVDMMITQEPSETIVTSEAELASCLSSGTVSHIKLGANITI